MAQSFHDSMLNNRTMATTNNWTQYRQRGRALEAKVFHVASTPM